MSDFLLRGRSDDSTLPDMDCLGITFMKCMKENQNKIAQIDGTTGMKQTYKELLLRSIRVAQHMQEIGITSDDIISICSYNSLDSCLPFLAAQYLGIRVASLDPTLSYEDSEYLLKLVEPKFIFCCEESVDLIEQVIQNTELKTDIIVFNKDTDKYTSFSQFLVPTDKEDEFEARRVGIFDTAVIFFSSGTTGLPKGICNSHFGLISQQRYILTGHDNSVFLYFTTFYWISAVMLLITSILKGGARVIFKKFDVELVMKAIEEYKVSYSFISPFYSYKITSYPKASTYNTSSLKTLLVGGGKIEEEQMLHLKNILVNTNVYNTYGMTEVGGCATIFHPIHDKEFINKKLMSVGRLVAGITCKVVDPDSKEKCGPNVQGEIMLKGDCLMLGYHNNIEGTRKVWDDEGFLHTGDIGYYDEDQCFYIVDRIKDVMKYQSWHVIPFQLESLLKTHPDVKEAAVIGIPHEVDGEHPMGVVVTNPEATSTPDDILKFFNEQVPDRKKLHGGLIFVDSLPHTPSGKVRRFYLKKNILNNLNK